jgi:bifunctional diaminopimelate decarboxylase / aspartate kinase
MSTPDSSIATDRPWLVMKFGGTSVSTRARWENIAKLANTELRNGRRVLIVVSALSGITDQLKALCEAYRDDQKTADILAAIRQRHVEMAEQLEISNSVPLAHYLAVLDGLAKDSRRPSQGFSWQAEVLSMGEILSSTMGAAFLSRQLQKTEWVDARQFLTSVESSTDSDWARYLSVNCHCKPSLSIQAQFESFGNLLITQGFIARNIKQETVILGRGGSDTSAAYFAALLQAEELQIWTDVPGMFSANPRKVPGARLLNKLDYDEAQEIATTGAKVLHPRCLAPVREANVPLLIKDTERPELPGTWIGLIADPDLSVKAVSVRNNLTLVSMESLGMWQQVGFLADVFAAFKQHGLSVDLIGSSETNVTISLDPTDNLINATTLAELCSDLAAVCRVKVIAPCAAITLVGRGMRSQLHKLMEVWQEVGASKIYLLTQSSNDLNLTFVVDEDRAEHLLPVIHDSLIKSQALPVAVPGLLGPAWKQLQSTRIQDAPWWRAQRSQLLDIAQAGPQYVYSRAELQKRLAELNAMHAIDQWFYACKANHHPALLKIISEAGFGLECVSIEEINYVRQQLPTHDPKRILFSANFAPQHEYQQAIAAGVQITLDSVFALEHWPDVVRQCSVHLRLDLGFGGGHHAKVNTGGDRSKFGLSLADLNRFKELAKLLNITVIGLHAHLGSGIRDVQHWPQVYAELALLAEQFPAVRTLNLGGGLGVPSRADDDRLDLHALNQRLAELKALYPQYQIRMEPGRYPVAECGVLLTRVTQIKSKGKGVYVGLDTGMNSLIRPALYDAYHEIVNLTRLDDPPQAMLSTVVGPICETGDVLGQARALPVCQSGDVMLIAEAGAYGAVMSSHYNLRQPAIEVVL